MTPPQNLPTKAQLLAEPIRHLDIKQHDVTGLVDQMKHMAFSSRDLARAADIYDRMLADTDCAVILCLAGSMVSAGLKQVIVDLVQNNMVDAIVSTGANIVDQDLFEAMGFQHYKAPEDFKSGLHDGHLRELMIDRIYDTFIDEEQLRVTDETCQKIAEGLEPRPYTSREFVAEMGKHLDTIGGPKSPSVIYEAWQADVPIFMPAAADCSAGLGLVPYLHQKRLAGEPAMSLDAAADFYELTQIKLHCPTTGLLMLGGGVPKNYAQDIVVAADLLGEDAAMHRYAIQITVADERDGALSGSTLKEASSWGKVDTVDEQMVYSEATLAFPLIAGYAYHKGNWKTREGKRLNQLYTKQPVGV
jgi:deoxyhypusine synthase